MNGTENYRTKEGLCNKDPATDISQINSDTPIIS